MNDSYWFDVTVKVKSETDKGVKWENVPFLIGAASVSDAETKVAAFFEEEGSGAEYKVSKVSEKKIYKILK